MSKSGLRTNYEKAHSAGGKGPNTSQGGLKKELRSLESRSKAYSRNFYLVCVLAIILIGWVQVTLRLGERSLWADEGATAYQAQQIDSIREALDRHQGFQFLHLVLTMGTVRLSRSELALRLPSAIAATLAIPVLYVLGSRLAGRTTGLVAAFLLAISPFAIAYAQEARAYALLELLACLSLLFLLLAVGRRAWIWWAAFVLATTLLLYTHLFAWFVVAAEVLFALILLLWTSGRERRLDRRLAALLLSLVAIGVLYLPLLPALVTFWQRHGPGNSSVQGAGLQPFQLSLAFFRDLLSSYGPRSYGWRLWLFGASGLLGLVGLAVWRKWSTLLLFALWLAVPLTGLALISSEHFFEYRYLIFILPIFLLVTAEGVTFLTSLMLKPFHLSHARPWPMVLALGLAGLLFVPANLPALRTQYRSHKENWRDIAEFTASNILPDEKIYVSPRFWANPLLFYRPTLAPYVVGGSNVDVEELATAAREHAGLWYMRHVTAIGDPTGKLSEWAADQQFELLIDGYACGMGISVYYRRTAGSVQERQTALLHQAASFCPSDPRFQAQSE